jgi:hypothetical protein
MRRGVEERCRDKGKVKVNFSRRFTPRERAPCTLWIGRWAPEPFWMRWRREKFPAPVGNRTLEAISSSPSPEELTGRWRKLSNEEIHG